MKVSIFPPIRRLKKYFIALFVLLLIKIPWTFMMYESGESVVSEDNKDDVFARRAFLIENVIGSAIGTQDMPSHLGSQFQGEWALVTYSMLSSALTNIAHRYPETQKDSLQHSHALIELTLTENARRFDTERWGEDALASLDGPNGHIGYLGHLNWMLSAYRYLGGKEYADLSKKISEALARKLTANGSKCLATYPFERRYSADNLVVVASLANYAKLDNGNLRTVVQDWVREARTSASSTDTGLIPFHYDSNCEAIGDARGSGAGWNSFYLPFVDRAFADQQYKLLKDEFVQTRIITGIREYRKGKWGIGDVDSGPVLFGFSPSGTGFSVGGATHAADKELLTGLMFTSEFVGSTIHWNGKRQYLLAPMVGEAIMLAMKTAIVWDGRFVDSISEN